MSTADELAARLASGEVTVLGQVSDSSNVVVVVEVEGIRAVHKPVAGERPLWDFPDGTLAAREHATWLVSRILAPGSVPVTVLREGPWGPGSFQSWVEEPVDAEPHVALVPAGQAGPGWLHVLSGEDENGEPVDVVHRADTRLRRLALLDVVVNNSDRKGGHVLVGPDSAPVGIDHGLTFHADPKLRTVLWGWIGTPLEAAEIGVLRHLDAELCDPSETSLGTTLRGLLSTAEVDATLHRTRALVEAGTFPAPDGRWPAVPWPPF